MLNMLVLLTSLAAAEPSFGQAKTNEIFGFFGGRDIDYWAEGKRVKVPLSLSEVKGEKAPQGSLPPVPFSGSNLVRSSDAASFSWSSYRDPTSPEFWDDGGDWIPPRPFREAAARPTAENVDEYLAWQVRKTEVLTRFQMALSRRGSLMLKDGGGQRLEAPEQRKALKWRDLEITYFYQTACPHCRSSKETVEEARRLGARVVFVQLDHQSSPPLHTPSIPYDAAWHETFRVLSTPTWVLTHRGKTLRHKGAMSSPDLRRVVSSLTQHEE